MSDAKPSPQPSERHSVWADGKEAALLRRRIDGFWNRDYFGTVVVPLLNLKPGDHLLDVGSGYGALTLALARALPDVRLTGVDLEPKAVADAARTAQTMGFTHVRFEEGDAAALPYPDATFEAVVCQTLLAHVPDAAKVIHEMARVLKPGGHMLAVEYHITSPRIMHTHLHTPLDAVTAQALFQAQQDVRSAKRAKGRGDDFAAVQVPFYMMASGLRVVDVRANDRVWHAFPPYAKHNEQLALETVRESLTSDDDAMTRYYTELLSGTLDDDALARTLEHLTDTPAMKQLLRQALEDGTLAYLYTVQFLLVFARKPA